VSVVGVVVLLFVVSKFYLLGMFFSWWILCGVKLRFDLVMRLFIVCEMSVSLGAAVVLIWVVIWIVRFDRLLLICMYLLVWMLICSWSFSERVSLWSCLVQWIVLVGFGSVYIELLPVVEIIFLLCFSM